MEGKGREGEGCRDLKLSVISEYVIKNGCATMGAGREKFLSIKRAQEFVLQGKMYF